MAQLARYRANAPALKNDLCIGHNRSVRFLRTLVNVEKARHNNLMSGAMGTQQSIGNQLRRLQERAGLSYEAIANLAGYSGRSSVQRFFSPEYNPVYLPLSVAEKLAKAFQDTEVGRAPILALAGVPQENAKVLQYGDTALATMVRDVPVFTTILAVSQIYENQAIEQITLGKNEVIGHFQRPSALNGRDNVYGLYIQGGSMSPRFEHGESAFVERDKPARIGDEVVVYMRRPEADDEGTSSVMIKRLVRLTADYIELQQFNPAVTFKVDRSRILRIDRVIPWAELLS